MTETTETATQTEEPIRATEVLIDLHIGGGTLVLSEDQALVSLSPEDTPDVVTAQTVIDIMKAEGGKYTVVSDWDLLDWDDITINVQMRRWERDDKGLQRLVTTHAEW